MNFSNNFKIYIQECTVVPSGHVNLEPSALMLEVGKSAFVLIFHVLVERRRCRCVEATGGPMLTSVIWDKQCVQGRSLLKWSIWENAVCLKIIIPMSKLDNYSFSKLLSLLLF